MRRVTLTVLMLLTPLLAFTQQSMDDIANSTFPLLDEVQVFSETNDVRFRLLLFRGGYEHVTGYIVIQKYSVEHNGQAIPYTLVDSISISEINGIYNFGVESITDEGSSFLIELDAIHSYIFKETVIHIRVDKDLEYQILDGLVNFEL